MSIKYYYKVHTGNIVSAVEAKTPQEAITKFIKQWRLQEHEGERARISVAYIANDLIK